MKLDKFKELLIKKAEGDPHLQILIKYAREDFLLENIIESLEKMARASQQRNANFAVQHFGSEMDPDLHPDMIRDALSHHATQYKSALNNKNNKVANKHADQIFKYMHMINKLTDDGGVDHTNGSLKVEAVDPKPWERNHYQNKNAAGKFSTNTKGWSRGGLTSDYSWLQQAPHDSHRKEISVHGHNGAYPLEQIKVNGKYLHIGDHDDTTNTFESHPLDNHPIMSHYKKAPKDFNEENYNKYLDSVDKYHDEEGHMDAYFDKHEALQNKDPEAYAARGINPSEPIHAAVENPLSLEEPQKKLTSEPTVVEKPAQSKNDKLDLSGIDEKAIPADLMARLKERGLV